MPNKRNQLQFYAAGSDLADALSELLVQENLGLLEAGMMAGQPASFSELTDVPSLGTTEAADQASDRSYLVYPKENKPRPRPISQKAGGTRYAYDQQANPESVVVKPGGWNDGFVIAGQIGTVSDHENSVRIYNQLARQIRRKFKKVASYYVGPAAEVKMRNGARLTYSRKAPKEYDLRSIDRKS